MGSSAPSSDPSPIDPPPRNWKEKVRSFVGRIRLRRAPSEPGDPSAEKTGWSHPFSGGFPGHLHERLKHVEFVSIAEWASQALQKRGLKFYGKFLTIVICCFFLGDVIALLVARYIPEAPLAKPSRFGSQTRRSKTLDDYNVIATRNLFNSKGVIPGEEATATPGGEQDLGGPAVKTSLPFNLVGTLILRDEFRSIATIEDKSASSVFPVRVTEEIPGKARILKVEPDRVTFQNLSNGRREFVELPPELLASNAKIATGAKVSKPALGTGITQKSADHFSIARSEVDKAMADFNNILTQARAVPNFENGVPAGFKLFQIVPGSIYAKLGLENGDVILGMNGEPLNDPGKAFEALNALRAGAKEFRMQIKRNGKVSDKTYDIN